MTNELDEKDLGGRLKLIEEMMAEGRRSTRSWGWTFVLWGMAYYVATAWATWGRSNWAWPVTMVAAAAITAIILSRSHGHARTTLGRAVGAIWTAMGCSIFILMMSLAYSGHYDGHVSVAIIGAMIGMTNLASAIILKWKMQFACAIVWLASAVIACFGPERVVSIDFIAAIFFCQIVFGIYAMICESRRRRNGGVVHA